MEWSRSRYWLCHFLQSRHQRPRVSWDQASNSHEVPCPAVVSWLRACRRRCAASSSWLIDDAAHQHADDPAYVQSLRLLLREQEHHGKLIDRWLQRASLPTVGRGAPHPLLAAGQNLGVRYTLSVILLDDLLDLALLPLISHSVQDPVLRAVVQTLQQDKAAHVAFAAERLTIEFADFNAMRRNLRRLRLRVMFAACLLNHLARHRPLLAMQDSAVPSVAAGAWSHFNRLLEQMVPYRREALMAALISQQREPYARARLSE